MNNLCFKTLTSIANLGVAKTKQIILLSGISDDRNLNSVINELKNEGYIEPSFNKADFRITQFGLSWLNFIEAKGSFVSDELLDTAIRLIHYLRGSRCTSMVMQEFTDEFASVSDSLINDAVSLLVQLEIFTKVAEPELRYKINSQMRSFLNYLLG